jgi:hypothetical protein
LFYVEHGRRLCPEVPPEYATAIRVGLDYLHAKVPTLHAHGRARHTEVFLYRGLGDTVARAAFPAHAREVAGGNTARDLNRGLINGLGSARRSLRNQGALAFKRARQISSRLGGAA